MPLQFLDFELSEDSHGLLSWDALASPQPRHTQAMLQEVRTLLVLLHQALGPCGPVDEGHRWDMDLQIHNEQGATQGLDDPAPTDQRLTLTLSLTGDDALGALLA
jgi:hypothetical protein